MPLIEVWAPQAQAVELESGEHRVALQAQPRGWWRIEAPWLVHGGRYGFRLDGEGPFPDPRSPWQREGVLGLSAWVDHGLYAWSDQAWQPPALDQAVFYELHVGSFSPEGSFDAVVPHLPRLAELGVTHLELMPVGQFPGQRGWGYDGVQPYAVQQSYGGPHGLKRLVDAAHRQGLAVVLDVVYNHLGPEGNFLPRFGPYLSETHRLPWGAGLNFDGPGSDGVRDFCIGNARQWLRDYHLDGLRLDAVHAIFDASALHFLRELAAEVQALEDSLGRPLLLIAESDLNDPRLLQDPTEGGYGLHAQWNEDFQHALHAALTGERRAYYADYGRIADLALALEEGFVYTGQYSAFRRRRLGQPPGGLPAESLLGYLQNHDQVGNRPHGFRSSRLLSPAQLKVAAAFVLLGPYTPLLFAGEEWGARSPFHYFTDFGDPALGKAVREGRRKEMAALFGEDDGHDPQDPAGFHASRLDWEEAQKEPHADLWAWHQALLKLRRGLLPTDRAVGELDLLFNEEAGWMLLRQGPLLMAACLRERACRVPWGGPAELEALLASDGAVRYHACHLELPAHAVGVWKCLT